MPAFQCPRCRASLTHPTGGDKTLCPKCGQKVLVPMPPPNKTTLGLLPGEEAMDASPSRPGLGWRFWLFAGAAVGLIVVSSGGLLLIAVLSVPAVSDLDAIQGTWRVDDPLADIQRVSFGPSSATFYFRDRESSVWPFALDDKSKRVRFERTIDEDDYRKANNMIGTYELASDSLSLHLAVAGRFRQGNFVLKMRR